MKTKLMQFLIIIVFSTLAVGGNLAFDTKYSIKDIRAHLFHQSTGEINPANLLDGKSHVLWNTPIGEGEALSPSGAVLVVIEIMGPSFSRELDAKLVVKAITGNKTLLDKSLILGDWFCSGNKISLPFLIYGTGCGDLEITARLDGLPDEAMGEGTLTKTIPFRCGE